MTGTRLLAYRASWPADFGAAATEIAATLASRLDGPVEHIGSTAVPGMIAKPQIDMMAPVRSLDEASGAVGSMAALGYELRPHRRDAVLLVRPVEDGTYSHSLHLTTRGSALWTERLVFRDAVRADPALRDAYIDLKLAMLAGPEDYAGPAKRDFVRQVLAAAGCEPAEGLHRR